MNLDVALRPVQIEPALGLTVTMIGGVAFVAPVGRPLSPRQQFAVEFARRLVERGDVDTAAYLVGLVQRDLGVLPCDHVKAVEAAGKVIQRALQVGHRQVEREELARVQALPQPLRAVPISATAWLSLDRAEEARLKARRAVGNRDRRAQTEALAEARLHQGRAQAGRDAQLDGQWSRQAHAEALALVKARGDSIVVERLGGVDRISRQDGLDTVVGSLTDVQAKTARLYRYLYEEAPQALRSQMAMAEGRGGVFDPAGAGLQKAYASARLTAIHRAVEGLGERELVVLKVVAGEGRTLRSLGEGGNTKAANLKALRRALDKAAWVIWNMRGLRIRAR